MPFIISIIVKYLGSVGYVIFQAFSLILILLHEIDPFTVTVVMYMYFAGQNDVEKILSKVNDFICVI